ncbi:amidohydrolase family protein [Chloroflexota bacterium]
MKAKEALRMMTIDAAYALFMEEKIGSLKPGKFADLIILSDNPLTVDPNSLIDFKVLMTKIGGRVEHSQAEHKTLIPEGASVRNYCRRCPFRKPTLSIIIPFLVNTDKCCL